MRPNLRVVREKTQNQLDLQACHRVRSRLVSRRTAAINQIRAFLVEQGITVKPGARALRNSLFEILKNRADEISAWGRRRSAASMRSALFYKWKAKFGCMDVSEARKLKTLETEMRAMGIRDRPTSPRWPRQNGHAERLIGSIRRECLDDVVIFGGRIAS